ncbi:MAG: proprotein convertase P-domain-containing protein [Planctomycetota bacterium]
MQNNRTTLQVGAALLIAATAGLALAGPKGPDAGDAPGILVELKKEKGETVYTRRLEVAEAYTQTRAPARADRVIYGDDDRREVYEYDALDPTLRAMADAAAVVIDPSEVVDNGDGTYTLLSQPWTSVPSFFGSIPLCEEEPFFGQASIGFCSSFLVGPDIIVTAGHCVDAGDISSGVGFLFGFQLNDADETGPTIVPADKVYFGDAIINQQLSGGFDHSVVRLDRAVSGISPVPIRREGLVPNGAPLAVIGHPAAIIKKIAGGAIVLDNLGTQPFIQSNLDTYGGNSGSMVINLDTYVVEGILVRGAADYVDNGGCQISNRLPDEGVSGEEVSKTISFASDIPALGLQSAPSGPLLAYGAVGGPFVNSSVSYTLSNPTTDTLEISISQSNPAAGIMLDASMVSIPAGGNAVVTASLDTAAAALFGAGVYSTDVSFDDTTNGRVTTFTHTVEIGQTLIDVAGPAGLTGGGPNGGPFPGSASFVVASERPQAVDVSVSGPEWVRINGMDAAAFSLTSEGDSQNVEITFGGIASGLPNGLYEGEVVFANETSGTSTSLPVALDIGRFVFAATDAPLSIPDNQASGISSSIEVAEAFCVADVDVEVDINHTYSGDLLIELTGPGGQTVRLHNRTGGSASFTPITYDDDVLAPDGPGALADFDGTVSAGTWTLSISDNAGSDTGTLNAWSLRVAEQAGDCPPQVSDASATIQIHQSGDIALQVDSIDPANTDIVVTSLPAGGVIWDKATGEAILSVPATLAGDTLTYRANIGFLGNDSFDFEGRLGSASAPGTATIDVVSDETAAIASFGFESDPGWAREGSWDFGTPTGSGGAGSSGPDPTNGFTGDNVFGNNLSGNYASNLPVEYLTTDPINVEGETGLAIQFRRWLGMESSSFDQAGVEARADGGAWELVWAHEGGSFGDDAWTLQSYDVSQFDGASTIEIRWYLGPTDTSVTYPGWNLDDVEVRADSPVGSAFDFSAGNGLDVFDVIEYLALFDAGNPLADLDANGVFDIFDVILLLGEF